MQQLFDSSRLRTGAHLCAFFNVRFYIILGDGNWQQAEACILLLFASFEVNTFAQEALRRFI